MRYIEMIKLLQEQFTIENLINFYNAKISDVKLIDKDTQWDEKILYVGTLKRLRTKPKTPIMLISCDENIVLPEGSSISHISKNDVTAVYNFARDLIFEELRFEAALFELTQAVLAKKNLTHLMNMAADLLGNAIILTDGAKKVLAHATKYEIMDPLWAENVERGFLSYEFMQKVRINKQMKEWDKQGRDSKLIVLPGDKQPKLVARIISEGHITGSLIMIEHHTKIKTLHYKVLPLVGEILFESFSYDSSKGMYNSLHSSILYNMLDERELNKSEMLNMSKVSFPKTMQVVVAQFSFNNKNRYLKFTLRTDLERLFPDGFSVLYKSYIGVLVPDVSYEQKERLKSLASEENINVGISWKFDDINQFSRHFYQAVTCIKQSRYFNTGIHVHDYTDFSCYDMLLNCWGETMLENYCHPALKIIYNYDIELHETLKKYLECSKNATFAAEQLFIHRNTLNYRIKKIEELTGLDLDNHNVVQCLMDSFRIESLLNLKKVK